MLKKYFARITMFTVLASLSLVAFVIAAISHQADVIKDTILYHFAVATITFAGIDLLLKQILKLKTLWVWIIQIFLLLLAIYIWIVSE